MDEHGHPVPGLEHLPAVDALDRDHVHDKVRPVDPELLVRQAQHGDLAAVGHVGEHLLERRGAAGHLEADIESLTHAELAHRVGDARARHVDREGQAHRAGQLEPVVGHVSDDYVTGAGVTGDDRRHDPDRSRSGDEDVLAENREG